MNEFDGWDEQTQRLKILAVCIIKANQYINTGWFNSITPEKHLAVVGKLYTGYTKIVGNQEDAI